MRSAGLWYEDELSSYEALKFASPSSTLIVLYLRTRAYLGIAHPQPQRSSPLCFSDAKILPFDLVLSLLILNILCLRSRVCR